MIASREPFDKILHGTVGRRAIAARGAKTSPVGQMATATVTENMNVAFVLPAPQRQQVRSVTPPCS
jgi:hypothetical protein